MAKMLFILIVIASIGTAAVLFYSKKQVAIKPTPAVLPTSTPTAENVPLPAGEDIIRTFFELINKRRFPEVLAMMDSQMIPDDAAKQEWTVSFNGIASIVVTKIDPYQPETWPVNNQIYQVTLQVRNQYGVPSFVPDNGKNTRWVRLRKAGSVWKIAEIATGP